MTTVVCTTIYSTAGYLGHVIAHRHQLHSCNAQNQQKSNNLSTNFAIGEFFVFESCNWFCLNFQRVTSAPWHAFYVLRTSGMVAFFYGLHTACMCRRYNRSIHAIPHHYFHLPLIHWSLWANVTSLQLGHDVSRACLPACILNLIHVDILLFNRIDLMPISDILNWWRTQHSNTPSNNRLQKKNEGEDKKFKR